MNPQQQFCPNMACPERGKVGNGNIVSHSRKEQRYKCKTCGKTFSETKGTALYGIKKDSDLFVWVVTLLAFGCPTQAIVQAFGLDERTVQSWQRKAGEQCQQVHEQVIGQAQLDLQQVQADEIKVKTQMGVVWMALAIMVHTRLWLGGVVGPRRDKAMLQQLADQLRNIALCRTLLLAVDGWRAYVDVLRKAFRTPLQDGSLGRPRLIAWADVHIVQVVKQRSTGQLTIERRIVQGCAAAINALLCRTQGRGIINTAYIERLNATFRQRMGCLSRRTRHLARQQPTLQAGMYLVGTVYNFCTYHHSLRLKLWLTERTYRWVHRTPIMAAGLSDHCWSVHELMTFKVAPAPYIAPKRRGRKPKSASQEAFA